MHLAFLYKMHTFASNECNLFVFSEIRSPNNARFHHFAFAGQSSEIYSEQVEEKMDKDMKIVANQSLSCYFLA